MSTDTTASNPTASEPALQILGSRHVTAWLAEVDVSLAFTTYQTGKLFLIGRKSDQTFAVFERTFSQCMGLWASSDAQTLWMSSKYQLWRFENALVTGQQHLEHDRVYVPRVGYTTGDLDIHDIAVEADGRVVFVNTLFGCVATLSDRLSFTPLWRPPFLSKLAPSGSVTPKPIQATRTAPPTCTVTQQSCYRVSCIVFSNYQRLSRSPQHYGHPQLAEQRPTVSESPASPTPFAKTGIGQRTCSWAAGFSPRRGGVPGRAYAAQRHGGPRQGH